MFSTDRCVLVDANGLIVNRILCDRATYVPPAGLTLLLEAEAPAQPPQPLTVPLRVSPRRFRLALNSVGLREAVETAVAAADQNTRDAWEYALEFERNDPAIIGMATALGLSAAQIDDIFRQAATL